MATFDYDPFASPYGSRQGAVQGLLSPGQDLPAAGLNSAAAPRSLLQMLIPGLMNYFTQQAPPPQITPNAAGKVPDANYNPNTAPALQDLSNIAMTAAAPELGAGLFGRGAAQAAESAPSYMPAAIQRIYDAIGLVPPATALTVGGAGAAGDKTRVAATPTNAATPAAASLPPAAAPGVSSPSVTGAAATMRPNFTPDDLAHMGQLQQDIDSLTKQRGKAIANIDGPKAKLATGAPFDAQIQAKQEEIASMRSSMQKSQKDFDWATQPIGVRNADALAQARGVAMGSSLGTGMLHGLVHRPGIMPWLTTAAAGGLEGSLGIVLPNLMDLGQPQGTPAHEAAEKNLRFISHPMEPGAWDYAQNVIAPEAAGGAGLGIAGHFMGHALSGGVGAIVNGMRSAVTPLPKVAPAPGTVAVPAPQPAVDGLLTGKQWPSSYRQIDMAKDANGAWYERGTGHKVPKRLYPPN
jgi:hypothetical protein